MRSWGAADETVAQRLSLLRTLTHELDPLAASPADLSGWLGNPKFAAWTRVTYFGHLHSIYEWLLQAGLRPDDPTAEMRKPKSPRKKPRPLTAPEGVAMLDAARGHQIAWVSLGLFAGLRAFEISKFRGEDITEEILYVRGKGGKDSTLPTHPRLWALAQTYPRTGWWFPSERAASGHVHVKWVTNSMTLLAKSVGVQGSTHRLRHTYGTNLLRGGANLRVVQELMRHDSLATTAGYLAVNDDEKIRAIHGLRSPR